MKKNKSDTLFEVECGSGDTPFEENDLDRRTNFQSRAPRSGADFKAMALARLREAGATIERMNFEIDGFPVDAQVFGDNGRRFLVLARGTPQEQVRGALRRTDTVEKTGFMAMQLARRQDVPILLITSDLPSRSTKAGRYMAALSDDVWDVISYRADLRGFQRLRALLHGPIEARPPEAPWRVPEPAPQPSLLDGTTHATSTDRPASGCGSESEVLTQDLRRDDSS